MAAEIPKPEYAKLGKSHLGVSASSFGALSVGDRVAALDE